MERHRVTNGKGTVDTSYYISSMSPSHKSLGHYIRQHWRIENSQHYILDVVFKEDNLRITLDGAVENIALFRRFVMNMLKQCDCGAPSQKVKLKKRDGAMIIGHESSLGYKSIKVCSRPVLKVT